MVLRPHLHAPTRLFHPLSTFAELCRQFGSPHSLFFFELIAAQVHRLNLKNN
jgi:hypothetical protein